MDFSNILLGTKLTFFPRFMIELGGRLATANELHVSLRKRQTAASCTHLSGHNKIRVAYYSLDSHLLP
jgi:hypothetical protein